MLTILLSFGLTVCNKDNIKELVAVIRIPEITKSEINKTIEIPENMFYQSRLNDNEFIVYLNEKDEQQNGKVLYLFNIEDKSIKKYIEPLKKEYYFDDIVTNGEWLVWIEKDYYGIDTSNKSFGWQLVAKNVKTSEELVIDKSIFTTNKYSVPMYIDYIPESLNISKQNIVSYCKSDLKYGNIISAVLIYDLNNRKQQVVAQSDTPEHELIVRCCTYGDKVVWIKFWKFNETLQLRRTRYEYGDIFVYDINTNKIEQLTQNQFYDAPNLYENYLTVARVPESEEDENSSSPCRSDIVLFDLNTKEKRVIFDKKSICNNYNKGTDETYNKTIFINDKYICWLPLGGGDNRYIYDYKNDNFVEVYEEKSKDSRVCSSITNMSGNCIVVNDLNQELTKTYFLFLK